MGSDRLGGSGLEAGELWGKLFTWKARVGFVGAGTACVFWWGETMEFFTHYRNSQVGLMLEESLEELLSNGDLSEGQAETVRLQFDRVGF